MGGRDAEMTFGFGTGDILLSFIWQMPTQLSVAEHLDAAGHELKVLQTFGVAFNLAHLPSAGSSGFGNSTHLEAGETYIIDKLRNQYGVLRLMQQR